MGEESRIERAEEEQQKERDVRPRACYLTRTLFQHVCWHVERNMSYHPVKEEGKQ